MLKIKDYAALFESHDWEIIGAIPSGATSAIVAFKRAHLGTSRFYGTITVTKHKGEDAFMHTGHYDLTDVQAIKSLRERR